MRDPERIDKVLDEIRKIWKNMPDLRLFQLLLNLEHYDAPLYQIEDDELVARLKVMYNDKL